MLDVALFGSARQSRTEKESPAFRHGETVKDQDLNEVIKTGLIRLDEARNCIYWHQSIGGVFGLSKSGPNDQCRIGEKVENLYLNGVTSVATLTPEAAKAWKEAAVYGK